MLHATILEAGKDYKVVLSKGVLDARKLLQPVERCCHLLEYCVELLEALRVALAVVGGEGVAVIVIGATLQLTRNKREEVGAKRLGGLELNRATLLALLLAIYGGVRHGHPALWRNERQRVRCL